MAKSMGFEKLEVFPLKAIKWVGGNHFSKMYKRIFGDHKDYRGKRLKGYTAKYAELKRRGFTKKDGTRYSGFSNTSLSRHGSGAANLQLTYKTRKTFHRQGYNKGMYELGWIGGDAPTIVHGQKDQGRDIISGIPKKELDWVRDQFVKVMDKEFKKKLKDITIVVGK